MGLLEEDAALCPWVRGGLITVRFVNANIAHRYLFHFLLGRSQLPRPVPPLLAVCRLDFLSVIPPYVLY